MQVNSGKAYSWSEHPSSVVIPSKIFLLRFCYSSLRQRLPRDVPGTPSMAMSHNFTVEKSAAILVKRHVKFKKPGKVEMLGWKLEENSGKICITGNGSLEHGWGHLEREHREDGPRLSCKGLQHLKCKKVIYPGVNYNNLKNSKMSDIASSVMNQWNKYFRETPAKLASDTEWVEGRSGSSGEKTWAWIPSTPP